MPFVPDHHSVETLPANCPYQPLDVRRPIGGTVRNRYPPDVHLLPEPYILCGSTRDFLPCILHAKRTAELTKLSVVVVEQEPRQVLETGISDLLFRPLEGWMIGYIQVNDLTIREPHDDEDVENTKPNRVLHKEVAGPHGLGLVLQKLRQA